MSRTEHETPPHAQDVPGVWSTTRQYPTLSSEDVEPRHTLAAFVKVALAVQARDVAQAAPEIRVARVEAARRALHAGSLTLHGQALAEKLLQAGRAECRHA
jgi:anti-sigma28 factor (negative regulator of flagellin synthesis)